MFEQLPKAREVAAQLCNDGIRPFEVVDKLNDMFEGFFYLSHGNIFCLIPGEKLADIVYSKYHYEES